MKFNTALTLLGFYSSISTAIITFITFVIAYLTEPLAGPYCQGSCISYPYTDIISRFPADYYWMAGAILLMMVYLVMMACIYGSSSDGKKIFGQIGLVFAAISAAILVIDYFLQLSVIQPSLANLETDGISLLTQFNPHGIFIALEEAGFFFMTLSFLSIIPVFSWKDKLERSIRLTLIVSCVLALIAFLSYSFIYGITREYRFEVAIISIDWLTLIVSGILLSIYFKRMEK